MLPNSNGLTMQSLEENYYLEAEGNYIIIHYINGKTHVISRTLQKIDTALENTYFYRTHNKYIINLKQIKSVHRGKTPYIILKNMKEIPLSVSKKDEFLEKLNEFARIV